MRMMKCYLANTDNGHFITANEAATGEPGSLTCPSCGCVLYVQPGSADEKPWFWHDQSTVPASTLMSCVHSDPEIKAEARLRKLRNSIGEMVVPEPVLSWHCVWCGQHYQGVKLCIPCGTGIYSIEDKRQETAYLSSVSTSATWS
ncbi:putative zinc ribbon protein [Trabulsiella odontotermitis]|uniref:putative zinc ribbon protein n=1 Tax=Trabulsiella odontotermitis TaxID=379893 RepID=UPI0006764AF1|nr:putative zinc ribbon protein [Trabulsiella odontotermitis]